MYPTLTDLLKDLFGIYIPLPVQTFGLFLGVSFACAAYTLYLELKRKESQGLIREFTVKEIQGRPATTGEMALSALFGFIAGFKLIYIISDYSEFINDTQGVILSSKGSLPGGIAGAALFAYLRYRDKEKQRLPKEKVVETVLKPYQLVGNFTMVAAVAGLIGAKLFHNLENLHEFSEDPIDALLSFSGLTMYGGLICGAIAVIWYGKKHGIKPLHLCDATAPGLMLAYGTGRLGCQLSGDGDWGIVNLNRKPDWLNWLPDWAWSYNYPNNVISEGIPIPGCEGKHCFMLPDAVYPTPLYESITCIALFFVLWGFRKRMHLAGQMFFIYLLLNGIERFFIEKIRVNTKYIIGPYAITQAEIISVCLVITGIAGLIYINRKNKKTHEPGNVNAGSN